MPLPGQGHSDNQTQGRASESELQSLNKQLLNALESSLEFEPTR